MEIPWETLGKIGAVVGGAFTGTVFIYKRILHPMFKTFRSNYNNLQQIPLIVESLDAMRAQLTPNGGASLRDSIDRMESNQIIMGHKQGVLLSNNNIALIQTDADGLVVEVSEPLCDMLDRSKEEILGNNWISLISPRDRDDVRRDWEQALEDRRNIEARFCFNSRTGEPISVYLKASPVNDSRGNPRGFVGTINRT